MELYIKPQHINIAAYATYMSSGLEDCSIPISMLRTVSLSYKVCDYSIGYLAIMSLRARGSPVPINTNLTSNFEYILAVAALWAVYEVYGQRGSIENLRFVGENIHKGWCGVFYYYRIMYPDIIPDSRSVQQRTDDLNIFGTPFNSLPWQVKFQLLTAVDIFTT